MMANTIPAHAVRQMATLLGDAERLSRGLIPTLHAAHITALPPGFAESAGRLIGTITGMRELLLKYALTDIEVETEVGRLPPVTG